ncbi:cell division protein FtsA [Entomospira culicis]|uniref:Cell division protein FtsA n=1 Tax=Entomospira culicis TaxID=2719989 RepID=A0A968KWU7_9SPIO|nr:cell division protein FtsA [Entomospira culicis]NIZ19443.1 cell division protein FtsA [Entomospira culicis]NIZ69652.1 cell division protein FtsA [Entomospira culicis]WDI36763.1 cell division protein FtsA [Entomospira culicis]WDI38392.1 cell division protein FtsA [Entomospira culicis]
MSEYSKNQDVYVAIDLGSATMKAVAAFYDEFQRPTKVAVVRRDTAGIRKGAILNLEASVHAIEDLLSQLEAESGSEIHHCFVGFSGEHIQAQNSDGVANVGLRGKPRSISVEDVEKVMDSAQAVPLADNREIAAIIPLNYRIDNHLITREPLNIQAVRLEARIHIITAPGSLLNNLEQAVRSAGRSVQALIYSPLACAYAVLSKVERTEGVILIEMGASTTKIAFFIDEQPHYNSVLPIGASSLTRDLAEVEKIPLALAEQLKIEHGICYRGLLGNEIRQIPIPPFGGRGAEMMLESKMCDILQARMTDIANATKRRLEKSGWLYKAKSIVIAGGGSQLPGASELFARIFDLSARSAYVMGVEGLDDEESLAQYGTVWGLLKQPEYLQKEIQRQNFSDEAPAQPDLPHSLYPEENFFEEERLSAKKRKKESKPKKKSTLNWIKENFF